MTSHTIRCALSGIWLFASLAFAQEKQPPKPPPDGRFKADILLFTGHPDDQIQITGYLARAVFDQHERVAVVFGNHGNAGGNLNGYEEASAVAEILEIEARRAMAALGIQNVWFLPGTDTPGQDVLDSLENWHHGNALEKAVRYIRLTRPDVVLTMLPMYVAGENHGDHQAVGVIATEAFDLAGDPTAFPEQLQPPRNRLHYGNLGEGLRPWQPQKLYYFSDTSHTEWLEGTGPKYSNTEISPSRHVPYTQFMAEQLGSYLTQFTGYQQNDGGYQALVKGDFDALPGLDRTWLLPWTYFIFGKSVAPASVTGDILEGISTDPVSFVPARGYRTPTRQGMSLEFGGPWKFYQDFWPAHNLERLSGMLAPEVEIHVGETLHVPLLIRNDSGQPEDVTLRAKLPEGWTELSGSGIYSVPAHDTYPIEAVISTSKQTGAEWTHVDWQSEAHGKAIGSVTMRVKLSAVAWGLPL
jgi:LmbE family N-acetylglucosaminyl deacetylase